MTEAKKTTPIEKLLGEKLLCAIGVLIVAAGASEHGLALQFARLIAHPNKVDPATVAALGRTDVRAQLQQIKIIARFRLESEKAEELIKLCDRIQDCFDRRNEIAHWIIMPRASEDSAAVLRTLKIKADGSLVPEKPYTAQQIREFATKLSERMTEFDRLLTASGLRKFDPGELQTEGNARA
jgi:hypothetical protein